MKGMSRTSGPSPASRPELIHAYGELPCVGLGDEVRAGNVRALLVVGGNPALVFPDRDATREWLSALKEEARSIRASASVRD